MKKAILGVFLTLSTAGLSFAQTAPTASSDLNDKTTHASAGYYTSNKINTTTSDQTNGELNFNGFVKTKTFAKSYNTSRSNQLSLTNKYGPMVIKVWDKNEVKAEVVMKATSDNEKDAAELINSVSIDEGQSGEVISIKTSIADRKGKFGTSIRNGKVLWKREINVSYVLYVPSNLALTALVQYGNLTLDDFNGPTNLKVQYGNLTTGNLNNSNNQINVQYGSTVLQDVNRAAITQQYGKSVAVGNVNDLNLTVQYAAANIASVKNNATIKVQYGSGLTLGSVENLNLNAQYANVKVSTIRGNATINHQYNALTIGSVSKLSLSAQYVNIDINEIKNDANIKASYNKLNIRQIRSTVKTLNINSSYVGINLAFDSNYDGSVNMSTRYTSYNGSSKISKTSENGSSKSYAGNIGSGGANSVSINAGYGSVTIK